MTFPDWRCPECKRKIMSPVVCQGCQMTPYCSEGCQEKQEETHKKWCTGQQKKLVEAYKKAKALMEKEFKDSTMAVVTALVWENQQIEEKKCVIGRIMWTVGFFRPCVFIVDHRGTAIFCAFHTAGSPDPYFDFKHLQPGNIMMVNRALKHQFMDGKVGLKIEDPSEVRLVRVM